MGNKELWYPSVLDAKRANKVAIENFRATKSERFEVLSHDKLNNALERCKKKPGSVEKRAVCLLKSVSDAHAFASGNRRTSYILMNEFLWKNKGYMIAKKKEYTSQLFKELRRRDVKEKEILNWYKHNERHI